MHNKIIIIILIIIFITIFSIGIIGNFLDQNKPIVKEADFGINVDNHYRMDGQLIKYKDLHNILADTDLKNYIDSRSKIICLDSMYRMPKIETARLGYSGLKELLYGYDNIFEWKENAFDCDKHSRVFKSYVTLSTIGFEETEYALTIGMLNFYYDENEDRYGHSLNIIIYLDGGDYIVKILEPQWLTSKFIRTYINSFDDENNKINEIFEYSTIEIKDYFEDYDNVEIGMILF
jgi:hypothetical protein